MIENEFMDASEKLTAFIDGELPKEEYGTLFYELAQNTELQDELSELIMIKSTFHNKLNIAPPLLKNRIMDKVGLGIPTLVERLLSPTLMNTFFSGQWFRLAALSSLMMFFGIVSVDQYNSASNRFTQQPGILNESLNQSSIPIITSAEISSESQSIVQRNNTVTHKTNSTHASNREPILNDRAMPLKPDAIEINETYKDVFLPIEKSKAHNKNFYSLSAKKNNFSTVDIKNTFLGRYLNDFSISLKHSTEHHSRTLMLVGIMSP